METPSVLLEKYRNDRRKLLQFLLSSFSNTPVNSSIDVELDSISVDYVLNCITSGEKLDLSEASDKYRDESSYPVAIQSPSGSYYFLCCDPDSSGSPPHCTPPKVDVEIPSSSLSYSSNQLDPLVTEYISNSLVDDGYRYINEADGPCELIKDANMLSFGLPLLNTGLSDDDLRETAYELLLSFMIFSGFQLYFFEHKKKESKSKFLSRLKSKREQINSQAQTSEGHLELLNVIRSQMQISEAMDICIRHWLMQFASSSTIKHVEIPNISLELLNGIGKCDFPSEKFYIKWKKRQANILEELLYYPSNPKTDEHTRIRNFVEMIKNNEQLDTKMSTSEEAKILLAIKKFSLKLSSMPGKFGIPGETCYWTSAYPLNINLYEKLLSSVFDILDEGQLVEEADEILRVIKLCWATLGISQKIHDTLYAWVLFHKFIQTGETKLLDGAIITIRKVQLGDDDNDEKQEAYMNSLVCSISINGGTVSLNLVDAIFLSISIWCENKLKDYHHYFNQNATNFGRVLTLYIVVGTFPAEESGDIKIIKYNAGNKVVRRRLKGCIENSMQAICRRLSHVLGTKKVKPKSEEKHPLAELANELMLIAEKESTVFSPLLCRWCPEAGMISSMHLHKFYGKQLKPFLDGVKCLSDDVRVVLPKADMLDCLLTRLLYSANGEDKLHSDFSKYLDHYQIDEVCKLIILDWVNSQHMHILEWTERAFDLEDWESLSFQQKHAASIVEVFRILEETVDQLFGLKLPLDAMHLQSLISVISRSLETYLLKMVAQLVEKDHLFPAAPALTRYKETVIPTIKKKSINCTVLEESVLKKLKRLTVSKLCVRINTLQYIQNKLGTLEDGIRESWTLAKPCGNERWAEEQFSGPLGDGLSKCSESVDEFFTPFNKIRKDAGDAINRICDFIGTRVVFWDLRDSFLFTLYRGNVEIARLESSLHHFDSVLDHICAIIIDTFRDPVVLSICQASMNGYAWVLLEGGPSRAFLDTDFQSMQEDLQILKDFFVADGEGLPPAVVEQHAILAQNIIYLYSLQSETLIEMLMKASEQVSATSDCRNPGVSCIEDAHTLLRVLCHKQDEDASKFLKRHYQLPKSSEYEDILTASSPLMSHLLKRSKSSHWAKQSQKSFRSMTKKLQEALP